MVLPVLPCFALPLALHSAIGATEGRSPAFAAAPSDKSDKSALSDKSGRDVSSYASCLNFSVPLSSVNFQFAQSPVPPIAVS